MRRLLSLIPFLALLLAGAAPAAQAATPEPEPSSFMQTLERLSDLLVLSGAEASDVFSTRTVEVEDTQPHPTTFDVQIPEATGLSKSMQQDFSRWVQDQYQQKLDNLTEINQEFCTGDDAMPYDTDFWFKPLHLEIHDGRYISASLQHLGSYCGGVGNMSTTAATFDAATGLEVQADAFARLDAPTTKFAILRNGDSLRECWEQADQANYGVIGELVAPEAWQASAEGMRLFYPQGSMGANACGTPEVLVPWGEIAPDEQLQGELNEQAYVADFQPANGNFPETMTQLAVQGTRGRLVVAGQFSVPGDGMCYYGVRDGDHALLASPMDGFATTKDHRLDFESAAPDAPLLPASQPGEDDWSLITGEQRQEMEKNSIPPTLQSLCLEGLKNLDGYSK